ncbi:MAG: Asp-tRNA(Asn)/Glu-tRNA(Gln) amidotransferase subunit GatC [Gammaproteobacteria bacterium]|nr:Asp-tRNA(Asn)/Glu-tRNA(Gln) amidotransferase subunit GatC [Gammaproteobacteria bacterium]
MSITPDDINHIARLARLKTDDEKSEFYATQLTRIMDLVEQMNQVDTDGIEPMSHPQDAALRLREDVVTRVNQREEYQAIAPDAERGFYLVPKVIE